MTLAQLAERQSSAYQDHDVRGFAACFAPDAVSVDGDGLVVAAGRAAIEQSTAALFDRHPQARLEVLGRLLADTFFVDHEVLHGVPGGPVHYVAVFDVAGDLIRRVQVLRR